MKLKKKFQIELLTVSNYTNQIKTLRTIAVHEQDKLRIIPMTHCSLQLKVGTTFFPNNKLYSSPLELHQNDQKYENTKYKPPMFKSS